MEKSPKSESYIIKEAQNVIEEYIKRKQEIKSNKINIWKEKYNHLILCTFLQQNERHLDLEF